MQKWTRQRYFQNFVSLPKESTVVVQWEDRGPWTHGTIEDKDNHNHHDRCYKICITKTEKIITQNRWHIRPTPISLEQYLCNQLVQHTKTNPLDTILNHHEKHPPPPAITDTTSERPHSIYTTLKHIAPNNIQNNNEKQPEENKTNITPNIKYSDNKENVIRTRYGRIAKKLDRLTYWKEHHGVRHRQYALPTCWTYNTKVNHFSPLAQQNKTSKLACYWPTSSTAFNQKS